MSVAVGDKVLLPEFGGAKVSFVGNNVVELRDAMVSHEGEEILLPEFGGAKVSHDRDQILLPEFGGAKVSKVGVYRKIRYVIYG